MYVDGYIDRKKEVLYVAERINGKRILTQHQPVYEFFVEDAQGEQDTITGTKAKKYEFSRSYEMRTELERYKAQGKKVFESDCNVVFKSLAKYYMGESAPDLHKVFFDIEVDFDKVRGFAPPDDPFNRITAISVYQSWTDDSYVLVIPPVEMPQHEAERIIAEVQKEHKEDHIIMFSTEKDMVETFFELIEDADVLSGWNSEFFDIPYMVNRTRLIFSEGMTTRFCLWGKVPNPKEVDNFGKTMVTYDLVGKVHLDYLALYKKHAGQVKPSYKLDDIGLAETGEQKVQYEGSLDNLYNSNFKTFVEYSLQDTVLLKKMDAKLDYISLHNRLAHQECVLIGTTMGSVALIDTAINNLIHKRGEVVFDKKPKVQVPEDAPEALYDDYSDSDDEEEDAIESLMKAAKAAGAWVQDPVQGLVDELGCVDFNSLYPSVLRALGMSTECILGQLRPTYTDAFLEERINEQRRKSKSKNFEPDWTEAWHGLFGSIEFTKVLERSSDIIQVDMESGETFSSTASDLYDLIFSTETESGIVLSANGTLFDKNKAGVIPEILTLWYTERKAMQKAKLDFKHFYTDGLSVQDPDDINIDVEALKSFIVPNPQAKLRRSNLDSECPVFFLRAALKRNNLEEAANLINQHFIFEDNRIKSVQEDMQYCKKQSAFWDQNQQIRKILLNSLYGALLNQGSRFYDKRLGQSVTLTGRAMAKHLASKINEVCGEPYNHSGGAVVYGDSVSGDSVIDIMVDGVKQSLPIQEVYETYIGTMYTDKTDKEYVRPDIMIKTYSTEKDCSYYDDIEYIVRHKNTNPRFVISTEDGQLECTSDHSIIAEVDGELGEYTPMELQELLDSDCEVYLITN